MDGSVLSGVTLEDMMESVLAWCIKQMGQLYLCPFSGCRPRAERRIYATLSHRRTDIDSSPTP